MQTASKTGTWRMLNRYYIVAVVLNFFLGVTQQFYNNTLTLHITSMGYSTSVAGTLLSVGAGTALVYRIFGGSLTERFGRKNLLLLGLLMITVGNFVCGIAGGLVLLYLASMVKLAGFAMASTSAAVMAVDVCPRERMSEGIGYFGLGMTFSQALAPTVGLALYERTAFFGTMNAATAVSLLAIVLLTAFGNYEKNAAFPGNRLNAPKPQRREGSLVWNLIERSALRAVLCSFVGTVSFNTVSMYLTHFAANNDVPGAGSYFFCMACAMLLSRCCAGKLADRHGTLSCVIPGYALAAAALLLLPFTPKVNALLYLSGILMGLGQGLSTPALNAEAVRSAPPERTAAASSTFMLQNDLSVMCGSFIWGIAIDKLGYSHVYTLAGSCVLFGLVLSLLLLRKKKAA